MKPSDSNRRRLLLRLLDRVEVVGNALPHPATIFALLALAVVLLSWVCTRLGVQATHPGTGELVVARNLVSGEGVRWLFESVEKNFVRFPPLGLVLTAMVGIGVAEGSGLLTALIRFLVLRAPRRLITMAVIFAGVFSHVASEAGYVVLIPLAAAMFLALGRHPMAGLAAAFAGVSGGFGANFVITSVDPVLAGMSESAAQILDPAVTVSPAANLYFMGASALLITAAGTWVTERIVEPRLGPYTGPLAPEPLEELGPRERRGLLWAALGLVSLVALLAVLTLPEGGLLRHPGQGLLKSAFFGGLITAILLAFLVPGLLYGVTVGTIRSDKDVVKHMVSSMSHMATYIVLVFFAAQFVYSFSYSNLGLILAIDGAEFLRGIGLTGIPLMVGFVLLSAFDQPLHGLGLGQVGDHGAGVRAHVHAARVPPRAHPGRLPHRGLDHQRDHADDVLLRAHRDLRREVRREVRHRHDHLHHAPLQRGVRRPVDAPHDRLDAAGPAGGAGRPPPLRRGGRRALDGPQAPALPGGGYSRSNSGSSCRSARSGSRRAHSVSLKPASHAFLSVSSASRLSLSLQ